MKDNPFQYQNIRFVPILHNRLEFALEVYRQILEFKPEALAVELPPTIQDPVLSAVKRLPYLSVVLYQEKSGNHVYLPIEPVDGIIEAVRSGMEKTAPGLFYRPGHRRLSPEVRSHARSLRPHPNRLSGLLPGLSGGKRPGNRLHLMTPCGNGPWPIMPGSSIRNTRGSS